MEGINRETNPSKTREMFERGTRVVAVIAALGGFLGKSEAAEGGKSEPAPAASFVEILRNNPDISASDFADGYLTQIYSDGKILPDEVVPIRELFESITTGSNVLMSPEEVDGSDRIIRALEELAATEEKVDALKKKLRELSENYTTSFSQPRYDGSLEITNPYAPHADVERHSLQGDFNDMMDVPKVTSEISNHEIGSQRAIFEKMTNGELSQERLKIVLKIQKPGTSEAEIKGYKRQLEILDSEVDFRQHG